MVSEMQWVAQVLSDFTPGAAGVWVIAAMVATWFFREYRETRKLSSEDAQARREGFTKDVARLAADLHAAREENRSLASDQAALRLEYKQYRMECQDETDALHKEIHRLRGLVHEAETKLRMFGDMLRRADRNERIDAILVQLDRDGSEG